MSTENRLGPYVLSERVGPSVWLGEDSREQKPVAIKVLTRELPTDAQGREEVVREVRSSAALFHTFLVPVIEVVEDDDSLVLAMERVSAEPLSRKLKGAAAAPPDSYNLAYQLAAVLKYLHSRQIVHANINSDSVMLTADGKLLLGGLNMGNLIRRGRSPHAFLAKRADLRSVAYMAPEQITTGEVDGRSDLYSLGVVLYETATGCLPHGGRSAAEIAMSIAQNAPMSPLAVNPAIPPALLTIIGRCLFKDPEKRYADPKRIIEAVQEAEPQAAELAARFEKEIQTAPAPVRPLLMLGGLADHDKLAREAPELASRASARMQMILGETVHLFDGRVIDSLGPFFVGELPSVDNALEAGRKAEFEAASDETLPPVQLLLHAGDVELQDGVPRGPAVEKALQTLAELPPDQLFISEEFVREGRGSVRLRDAGARAGTKLYTIVPAEPPDAEASVSDSLPENGEEEPSGATQPVARAPVRSGSRNRNFRVVASAVAALLVILAVVTFIWFRRGRENVPLAQNAAPAPVAASEPEAAPSIYVAPFTVESDDAELAQRANAMRLAAIAVLRGHRDIRLVDTETSDATAITAAIRGGPGAMEIITRRGDRAGEPRPIADAASGIAAVIEAATLDARLEDRSPAESDAINAFVDAIQARTAGEPQRTERSLRTSLSADPSFLPAQLMAMEFFASLGRDTDAAAAARQVLALDPANLEATRRVARMSLITGDLKQAFALFGIILERNPRDAEALNHYGRYALAAGDEARFAAVLERLGQLPTVQVSVHEPDRLAAAGRIDAAVQGYYAIEEAGPENPALALKIGRLAVLRHSLEIAEMQLARLERLDPLYGYHLLSAYIAAEKGEKARAASELELALQAAAPGDDSWTSAAEVHTILADTRRTLESLDRAARRKEPTAAYIIASPLFRYLTNEARFRSVRTRFVDQQAEIRSALESMQ